MSLSTKDQVAPRRRNRVYGANEPPGARLSGSSLNSNITAVSTSSNGSASTVTQDSYLKSKQPGEKKKKSRRRSDVSEGKLEKSMPDTSIVATKVDVFEFMIKEGERDKVQLDKAQPDKAHLDKSQSDRGQADKAQPEKDQLDTPQPGNAQPNKYQPDRVQPNKTQPDKSQLDKAQSDKSLPSRVQTNRSKPDRGQLDKPQLDKGQPQPEKAQFDKSQPDRGQSDEARPEEDQLDKFQLEHIPLEKVQPEMAMTSSQRLLQPKQETQASSDESDVEGYYRNQLSDSGISMGGITSEINTDLPMKHPLPPLIEEPGDMSHYAPSIVDPCYPHEPPQIWGPFSGLAYGSEPIPLSPASIRTYPLPQEYAYRGTPDPPSTGEPSVACLDSAPLVFRDRPNRRIQHPLVFRSFAKLNEKVLLQMQSNITDLEHDLATLDARSVSAEANARYKKGDYANISRHFTKDQAQRADLYQELHRSLEQYYESLASFHQISQLTSPCGASDSLAFKSWLRHQILPTSKVASLLGDGSDMVKFGSPSKESSDQTLRVIAYSVFANIFLPLLLFKFTSGVLSRLIILSVTTTVYTLMMERHRANAKIDLGDLHWHCIIGSAGVSLFAAILF